MMIRWSVQKLARERGINRPHELAERADIALNTAKAYWNGFPDAINLATMEKLCRALEVRPCDLMELSDETEYSGGNQNAELAEAA